MGVAEDRGAVGLDVVDVLTALHVHDPGAPGPVHDVGRPPDRPEGPHGRVHTPRDVVATALEQLLVGQATGPWALLLLVRRLARDVPEVVDRIVYEVAGEGLHGEGRPVAAVTGTAPLLVGDRVEARGQGLGGLRQLTGDHRRILATVGVLHGRGVLVPVGVGGAVPGEHQLEALVVEAAHVAHVARVLEGGPHPRPGARRDQLGGAPEDLHPAPGVGPQQPRHPAWIDIGGHEPALRARAVEHPGPVLVISTDRVIRTDRLSHGGRGSPRAGGRST
jgi:hypothetical protein